MLYCILSPYDNEQSDLIHRIKDDKNLEELPVYQQLVKLFTTPELINWAELGTDEERIVCNFSAWTESYERRGGHVM